MKQRVITALLLIPPVLAALFASAEWPIAAFALLVVAIGASEIARMLGAEHDRLPIVAGIIGFLAALFAIPAGKEEMGAVVALGIAAVGVVIALANSNGQAKPLRFLAAGWVAGPLLSLVFLHRLGVRETTWSFANPVLLAIVPLWGGDTAAIFAGKAFGKHPLAPRISPKKTWEGGIANLIACVLVAVPLAQSVGQSLPVGIGSGLAAGILGQAGDLFESSLKRKAGVKDSGTLLPGHGGIMDRIDSILFTAPAVAAIVLLAAR